MKKVLLKNINEIKYYFNMCSSQNISYIKLKERIKNNECERLVDNTKLKKNIVFMFFNHLTP